MEAAYYLLTGQLPKLRSHYDEREIDLIYRIYQETRKFDPVEQNKYLTLMPWGHCAGMPIAQYIASYRKHADGYRHNNDDLLARSLTRYIPAYAGHGFDDETYDTTDDALDDEMDDEMDDDMDDDMDDEWDDNE